MRPFEVSILPSITMCGMAALLPHKDCELTADYKMLVDGKPCHSTPERAKIIKELRKQMLEAAAALEFEKAAALRDEIAKMKNL